MNQTPLTGPPPAEIPLTTPPLMRVIAQVRFPFIASIEKREFIAPFQEAIRRDYPILRPEQRRSVALAHDGVSDTQWTTAWRFQDVDMDWTLTLAPDFIALETERYTPRDTFLTRLHSVLLALDEHINPQMIDRVGVRYIHQAIIHEIAEIQTLIRPELSGVLSTPLAAHTRHALSEHLFLLPDDTGHMVARWGLLPERATVDPAAVEPIDEQSWLLDLDAFQTKTHAFNVDATVAQARGFGERIYSLFRWAVTDELLRRSGAKQ